MAATVSPGAGGSDELFAEPAVALPLITQGAAVGAEAPTGSATHAAVSVPRATAPTPFDAAVQAALIALAEQDAAGADASVTSVITEEAQSAESLTRVKD